MLILNKLEIERRTHYPELIQALSNAFQMELVAPPRHHYDFDSGVSDQRSTLLLMPAWRNGSYLGVKVVTVSPHNSLNDIPSIGGSYSLFDAQNGELKALMDAPALTAKRTAAASALASRFLSKKSSESLLVIGTGVLAPELVRAHVAVRPITRVQVWGRNSQKAKTLADSLLNEWGIGAEPVDSLEKAASQADIISCATLSQDPLIRGSWLQPGQHVDLVGSYLPDMREADDVVISRCSLFVDTLEMAPVESGDLAIPIKNGVISRDDIQADLFGLCRGSHSGRTSDQEITCFKSVGLALEDLAAAEYLVSKEDK